MQAVLYVRSATDNPGSLAAQIAKCSKWAHAHGYSVVREYKEVALGGGATLRPLLAEAINHAEEHNAALIVVEPSRLSRNVGTFAWIASECQRRGMKVQYVKC